MSESKIIQNDKKHVWHHLTQHKAFESSDPLVVSKGKGMYVTDTKGDELNPCTPRELLVVLLLLNRVELVLKHLYERSSGHYCLGLSPNVFSGKLWLGRAHSAQ